MNFEPSKPMIKSKLNWTGVLTTLAGITVALGGLNWQELVGEQAAGMIFAAFGIITIVLRSYLPTKPIKGLLK